MRIRRVLVLVLITNLLTNALLLGLAGFIAWSWWSEQRTQPEPSTLALPPLQPFGSGASSPDGSGSGSDADGSEADGSEADGSEASGSHSAALVPQSPPALCETCGLNRADWQKIESGEVVLRRVRQANRIGIQAYFLIQGNPDELLALFTTHERLGELYQDVKKVRVLERDPHRAVVHYSARSGFFNLAWVVEERWRPGQLEWSLAKRATVDSKMRRAEGYWRFYPVASSALTLLCYRNDLEIAMVPDALIRSFASQNVPAIARRIQQQVIARRR